MEKIRWKLIQDLQIVNRRISISKSSLININEERKISIDSCKIYNVLSTNIKNNIVVLNLP